MDDTCPIQNVALWNITPPLQRKAILKLQSKQMMDEIDEQIKKNGKEHLEEVENNLKNKPSPENSMVYWGLTSPIRKKIEIPKKKEFIPKKEVQEEDVTFEIYKPIFKINYFCNRTIDQNAEIIKPIC